MFFGKVDAVKNRTKHILDFIMTAILLTLMAYPITGEVVHEWLGVAMFAAVAVHNLLNLKWYAALFKGNYSFLMVSAAPLIFSLKRFPRFSATPPEALSAGSGLGFGSVWVPYAFHLSAK